MSKAGLPAVAWHATQIAFHAPDSDIAGWPGGVVSSVHTEEDVQRTVAALEGTLHMLAAEGDL